MTKVHGGTRATGVERRAHRRVLLLLGILITAGSTGQGSPAYAATVNEACVDEAWKNYNTCLVKSGSWVCDLKFMMSYALCYVTPVL
jgi:hypothetical protein